MKSLDQALRREVPKSEAPITLHGGIMGAVRTAARTPVSPRPVLWPHWFSAIGLGTLILLGLMPSDTPVTTSMTALNSAVEYGDSMLRSVPASAMEPLSEEMEGLNRDVAKTKEFLLASLP